MSGVNAITLHVFYTPQPTDTSVTGRHGSAAAAAAAGSDGDGTVAMLCVVIDPNSWRGGASHEHNSAGPRRAGCQSVSRSARRKNDNKSPQ